MMKNNQRISGLLVSILLLIAAVAVTACAPASAQPTPLAAASTAAAASSAASPDASTALPTFTAEELAKYDGKNGNPAYVAVNGTVYDVSAVPEWKGGNHWGRFQAGRDLSEEIKLSPHGLSKLETVPVVGTYVK